jgi:TonB-dependent SusC/RagA subfamily outer membrane receptor|tara:strand:- start:3373 stop:3759 length:387 start_codon:yes stop_codon:yes gene_type:complete
LKNIILLIFILFSCNTSIKKNLNVYNPNELIVSKSSNISLLNRIRSNPGIYIEGGGENAKIYTKGITSINNQKEVLFILNGVQVGKFSQIVNILNPESIKSITVLKNANDIAIYGFRGSGGVILIKTQ